MGSYEERRTLEFVVKRQSIKKSSSCDFSGLVSGTEGYLRAKFLFSNEWDEFNKIAIFKMLQEIRMVKIDRYGECEIPYDILKTSSFSVGVIGEKKEKGKRVRMVTDNTTVKQKVV